MDELGLTSGRQAEGPPFFILINQRPDQALHVSLATTCDYSSVSHCPLSISPEASAGPSAP